MKAVFLVNNVRALQPQMTTTLLALTMANEGHSTWLTDVTSLSMRQDGLITASAHAVRSAPATGQTAIADVLSEEASMVVLNEVELLWLRVNPARDPRKQVQQTALELARLLEDRGVFVVNRASGLTRAGSKIYLHRVAPEFRPATLVTRSRAEALDFLESCPDRQGVIKPVVGTRGRGVFFARCDDPNLDALLETAFNDDYAMLQSYVPEAVGGDSRVVVLMGKPMELDGRALVVDRVPAPGSFRSNVHTGGWARPGVLTDRMRACIESFGAALCDDGLYLVGLDFAGDKVLEVNVFSSGGFYDAELGLERPFLRVCAEEIVKVAQLSRSEIRCK